MEITPDTEQRKLSQIDKTVVIEIYVKNYWSLILMSVVHITYINLCKETVICLPATWIKNYTRTMHVSSLNTKKFLAEHLEMIRAGRAFCDSWQFVNTACI